MRTPLRPGDIVYLNDPDIAPSRGWPTNQVDWLGIVLYKNRYGAWFVYFPHDKDKQSLRQGGALFERRYLYKMTEWNDYRRFTSHNDYGRE